MTASPLDFIIEGCRVIDGTGAPWFRADVGIAKDRIAKVGLLHDVPARRRIRADGLTLAPGLIDAHVHSEVVLLEDGIHQAALYQGVSTHIVGQDGFGFAPATPSTLKFMTAYLAPIYGNRPGFEPGNIDQFLARFDGMSPVNVATLAPLGCIRMNQMGNENRAPSTREIEAMAQECRQAMADGAIGISSGLDYVPGCYATTEELVFLARAIAPLGGIYVSHIRYCSGFLRALDEAISVGRQAFIPVHVSHLRPENGLSSASLLRPIEDARNEGIDVTFDTYPYAFGSTMATYLLPPWVLEGTIEDILLRLAVPAARDRIRNDIGLTMSTWSSYQIAGRFDGDAAALVGLDILSAAREADPIDFLCDLLIARRLDVLILGTSTASSSAERELTAMLRHPVHTVSSDGIFGPGRSHPRAYGACASFLSSFAVGRDLTLEQAVCHATWAPAKRFGLWDRGLVRPGYAADLFLFEERKYRDEATTADPRRPASGVQYVFVNGAAVLEEGQPTGLTAGRALRPAKFVRTTRSGTPQNSPNHSATNPRLV
jgi:N-acyl-D-amino-acid deacylase